jgi:pilin isopeptide linkage protein
MKRKILAIATMAMMCTIPFLNAFAATTYTPVAPTTCTFKKYFIVGPGDTVPNATFSFTVAPGSAVPASAGHFPVLAGLGTPTVADVTFVPGDTASLSQTTTGKIDLVREADDRDDLNDANDTLSSANGVQLEAGESFVEKTATVSFNTITFPEPGIYRYVITETANATHAAAGIMHDNDTDRILDVYVTDNGSGTLVVSSYVLHKSVSSPAANTTNGTADVANAMDALADKTDGFTNELKGTKDLAVKKEVSGNQASRDKYFAITVTMGNIADADVFAVSLADDANAATTDGNADATSGTNAATIAGNQGQTNSTSVTGAELKVGKTFYLQHGQSIAIRGFAPNATYAVVENAEDYKSTSATVTGYTDATSGTIGTVAGANKAVKTSFTNTRDGVVPTGAIMSVLPFVVVTMLGAAGYMVARKKVDDDEETKES